MSGEACMPEPFPFVPADLAGLAVRVREATGADRQLDADLACAFVYRDRRPAEPADYKGEYGHSPGDIRVPTGFLMAPTYTASLDAALALVERVLPDWHPHIDKHVHMNPPYWTVYLRCWRDEVRGKAPTPALALLSALLAALTGSRTASPAPGKDALASDLNQENPEAFQ